MAKWFLGNNKMLVDLEKFNGFKVVEYKGEFRLEGFTDIIEIILCSCKSELEADTYLGVLRDILMSKDTRFYEKYKDVEQELYGLKNT